MFDFSFTSFVTPSIVRVLYILITIVLILAYLGFVIGTFATSGALGILVLIFGAVVFFVYLALARVVLEFYMAIFRMADDMQAIRRRGQSLNG